MILSTKLYLRHNEDLSIIFYELVVLVTISSPVDQYETSDSD